MQNFLLNFWNGKITLWKSYWLVGELFNAITILIIFNIEIKFYNNENISSFLPLISFKNFHLLSKLLFIFWTVFITIGIWRSAEKYKGPFIWIVLTLIFLCYRIFSLRIIFF